MILLAWSTTRTSTPTPPAPKSGSSSMIGIPALQPMRSAPARTMSRKSSAVRMPPAAKLCSELLAGTDIDTGAAIGFPLGQTTIATKVFETKDALANGANEIDYVVNLTEVKAGNWDYIRDEMTQIVEVCREAGVPSKVIFENCLLTEDEKLGLCKVASEVLPDFVKTSTGFGTGGATEEDVRLMVERTRGEAG